MFTYLGLGTNKGDRTANLELAVRIIKQEFSIKVTRESSIIETKAWGLEDQPDFMNMVIEIETELSPQELLEKCLNIEIEMGRVREIKWGPRLIDIDILLYRDQIVEDDNLIIPHRYLHKRLFVLRSLRELIPEYKHPVLNKSIENIFEEIL